VLSLVTGIFVTVPVPVFMPETYDELPLAQHPPLAAYTFCWFGAIAMPWVLFIPEYVFTTLCVELLISTTVPGFSNTAAYMSFPLEVIAIEGICSLLLIVMDFVTEPDDMSTYCTAVPSPLT
jgi:hypothetical protein